MNLFFTLILILAAAAAWLFYAKFTKFGTVEVKVAWKHYTLWGSSVLMVFGAYIADMLKWAADSWDALHGQVGDLFANPSAGKLLQVVGLFFFVLKAKGQGLPQLKFPEIPGDNDKAGS